MINEFLADPSAVTDANGEWFEIFNRGTAAVNLQGYKIVSGNDAVHSIASAVTVPAGGYVVLARNASSASNGGVTVVYSYGSTITLANAGDWLALRDPGNVTADSVNWSSNTAGSAWGVKNPTLAHSTVSMTNWQLQTSPFGAGDKGTPGRQNDGYVAPPAAPVATVTVTPDSTSVAVGGTVQFNAQGYDAEGAPVSTTFTWSSSNAAVASVLERSGHLPR